MDSRNCFSQNPRMDSVDSRQNHFARIQIDSPKGTRTSDPAVGRWFESYLCGRSCQVSVKGSVSSETQLKYGIPQGSVIGPQVFTLYSHVIGQIIRQHSVLYHIYADDVQLFLTFNPTIPGDAACALFKLTCCIKDLQIWMTNNKLMMNPDKTEFFIASSHNHYERLQHLSLCLDVEIFPSPTARNLGTVFDHTIKMDDHVNQLLRSLNFHIRNLNRIRRFLDFDACHNAVRALILSELLKWLDSEEHHSPPKDSE